MPQNDDEPEFDFGPGPHNKTYIVTNTLETDLPAEFVFSTRDRYIEVQNVMFVDNRNWAVLPNDVVMHADFIHGDEYLDKAVIPCNFMQTNYKVYPFKGREDVLKIWFTRLDSWDLQDQDDPYWPVKEEEPYDLLANFRPTKKPEIFEEILQSYKLLITKTNVLVYDQDLGPDGGQYDQKLEDLANNFAQIPNTYPEYYTDTNNKAFFLELKKILDGYHLMSYTNQVEILVMDTFLNHYLTFYVDKAKPVPTEVKTLWQSILGNILKAFEAYKNWDLEQFIDNKDTVAEKYNFIMALLTCDPKYDTNNAILHLNEDLVKRWKPLIKKDYVLDTIQTETGLIFDNHDIAEAWFNYAKLYANKVNPTKIKLVIDGIESNDEDMIFDAIGVPKTDYHPGLFDIDISTDEKFAHFKRYMGLAMGKKDKEKIEDFDWNINEEGYKNGYRVVQYIANDQLSNEPIYWVKEYPDTRMPDQFTVDAGGVKHYNYLFYAEFMLVY